MLRVYCDQDGRLLGEVAMDTADMASDLKARLDGLVLGHRPECLYYGGAARPETPEEFCPTCGILLERRGAACAQCGRRP